MVAGPYTVITVAGSPNGSGKMTLSTALMCVCCNFTCSPAPLAPGIAETYHSDPSATTKTLAEALKLANDEGLAHQAAQATTAALIAGGKAGRVRLNTSLYPSRHHCHRRTVFI